MKYRIAESKMSDGSIRFYPQYEHTTWLGKKKWEYFRDGVYGVSTWCSTLEKAKEFIEWHRCDKTKYHEVE